MKLKEYLNPIVIVKSFLNSLTELKYFNKYRKIIEELEYNGSLDKMKIIREGDYLLIGIDLNPELLIYEEGTIESAELKLVAERMKKYSAFFEREGILDSIKADPERIKNDDYYGYLINITFNFKKHDSSRFRYCISYIAGIFLILTTVISLLIRMI